MKRILILCTGNSCRSQMAEGWLKSMLGDLAQVYSAGLEAHGINPFMKRGMEDAGIDISDHTSNVMEESFPIKKTNMGRICFPLRLMM